MTDQFQLSAFTLLSLSHSSSLFYSLSLFFGPTITRTLSLFWPFPNLPFYSFQPLPLSLSLSIAYCSLFHLYFVFLSFLSFSVSSQLLTLSLFHSYFLSLCPLSHAASISFFVFPPVIQQSLSLPNLSLHLPPSLSLSLIPASTPLSLLTLLSPFLPFFSLHQGPFSSSNTTFSYFPVLTTFYFSALRQIFILSQHLKHQVKSPAGN